MPDLGRRHIRVFMGVSGARGRPPFSWNQGSGDPGIPGVPAVACATSENRRCRFPRRFARRGSRGQRPPWAVKETRSTNRGIFRIPGGPPGKSGQTAGDREGIGVCVSSVAVHPGTSSIPAFADLLRTRFAFHCRPFSSDAFVMEDQGGIQTCCWSRGLMIVISFDPGDVPNIRWVCAATPPG